MGPKTNLEVTNLGKGHIGRRGGGWGWEENEMAGKTEEPECLSHRYEIIKEQSFFFKKKKVDQHVKSLDLFQTGSEILLESSSGLLCTDA